MSFEKYYFKREPFLPDLGAAMYGRSKEWSQIESFLNESFTGNAIRAFLVIGDYGFGKTFTLNKIREAIERPRSSIKNSAKTLCCQIILAETEPATSISHEYVTKIFYSIGMEKLFKIAAEGKCDEKKSSKKFNLILKGLANRKEEAFNWLIGETLSAEEKKEIGVTKKFSSSEALGIFMEFLKFLKMGGYENILVVINEFEYAINVYSEQKLTTLFHTFKNIYDYFVRDGGTANYAKHIQIIAITPKGYDVINDLEVKMRKSTGGGGITPWMERMRFERNQVSLGLLDDNSAEQLLVQRIEKERIKHKEVSFKTFPFIHPSFFTTMIEISKGKPRSLLDYSEIILEEAARRDQKEIDGDFVKTVLKEYGYAE
jgi:hypothetical protein